MQSVFQVNVGIAGGLPHPLFFMGILGSKLWTESFHGKCFIHGATKQSPFLVPV